MLPGFILAVEGLGSGLCSSVVCHHGAAHASEIADSQDAPGPKVLDGDWGARSVPKAAV